MIDTSCPAPSDIPNAVKTSSGLGVGSLTIYTCLPGFIPSSELNYITCNGSHWTDTNFTCFSGNLLLVYDWLIDWLIDLCFTPYRQYSSYVTVWYIEKVTDAFMVKKKPRLYRIVCISMKKLLIKSLIF